MAMTESKRRDVFSITDGRCFYCGCNLSINDFQTDHFIPRCKGGKIKNNLVPACEDCNRSKSGLSVEEFRDKICSMPTKNINGRIMAKYYELQKEDITFYFERVNDGDIQNRINDILDR